MKRKYKNYLIIESADRIKNLYPKYYVVDKDSLNRFYASSLKEAKEKINCIERKKEK